MKTSFADMNEQMEIIKKHLPSDRQPQIEELHGKLRLSQARMLAIQEDIEKNRGAVEGDVLSLQSNTSTASSWRKNAAWSFVMLPIGKAESRLLPSRITATRSKSTHGKIARLSLLPCRSLRKSGGA
ncbi:hypothetical protein CCGE531_28715 (plasmid) [Rhizobium sp. CCGE531]|nr:hypothetical protein CCGE531_28715 [Rhizobium sp. CCGE531]AYG76418.1 hypothetical protein CCGE532_28190 [Rhizobium sp. CCGE532]